MKMRNVALANHWNMFQIKYYNDYNWNKYKLKLR